MKKQVQFRCVFNRNEIKARMEKEAAAQGIDFSTIEESYIRSTIVFAAGGSFKSHGSFNAFIEKAIRQAPLNVN